ncbi:sodium:solute symporter family protein [Candidatus Cardinium hertigii]|uniref:sodium:solute symporter family protein n=1 Tax=Candidatus Cardinium hertigii TaxID=247481 RepID=UPI003D7C595C
MNKRSTNFQEYAVGHRNFSTATIVATIIACYCPGGILKSGITYTAMGVWYIVDRITVSLFPLLFLSWLSGKTNIFMYHISMPDTMGSSYSRYERLITALFEVCNSIIIVSLQIRVISETIGLFIPSVCPLAITILITSVMVIYAMFGGARAIAFTDVWQSIVFSTLIVILSFLLFKKIDKSIIEIIDFLRCKKQFELYNIMPSDSKVPNILRYLSKIFIAISPYLVHYVYMCNSPNQARRAFLYAGIFSSIIIASITVVGILVFFSFPDVPHITIWDHFISNISFPLKAIICIIMLSFSMSTVDSRLHIVSIMLAYDIPKSIDFIKRNIYFGKLKVAHIATLSVTILTIVFAFKFSTSMLVQMLIWYGRFYVPVVIPPFILAALGFYTTSPAALIGMITGLVSVFSWKKWMLPILDTNSGHVPCMFMNVLAMIIANYFITRKKDVLRGPT